MQNMDEMEYLKPFCHFIITGVSGPDKQINSELFMKYKVQPRFHLIVTIVTIPPMNGNYCISQMSMFHDI